MKVNFSTVLKTLGGADAEMDGGPLTLGQVAALALNAPGEAEAALRKGILALRLFTAGEEDVTPEDAALIRACLPSAWPPIIVAQAHALLEG